MMNYHEIIILQFHLWRFKTYLLSSIFFPRFPLKSVYYNSMLTQRILNEIFNNIHFLKIENQQDNVKHKNQETN